MKQYVCKSFQFHSSWFSSSSFPAFYQHFFPALTVSIVNIGFRLMTGTIDDMNGFEMVPSIRLNGTPNCKSLMIALRLIKELPQILTQDDVSLWQDCPLGRGGGRVVSSVALGLSDPCSNPIRWVWKKEKGRLEKYLSSLKSTSQANTVPCSNDVFSPLTFQAQCYKHFSCWFASCPTTYA